MAEGAFGVIDDLRIRLNFCSVDGGFVEIYRGNKVVILRLIGRFQICIATPQPVKLDQIC